MTYDEVIAKYGAMVLWRIKTRWYWVADAFSNIDMDDMIQEGYLGLMEAVGKYDPSRGKFTTCATIYIDKFIQLHIKRNWMNLSM